MKRVNEILLVVIFMLTAVLAAAVGLKAYDVYDTNRQLARQQEEMELAQVFARNEEVQGRVSQLQEEILKLAANREELERFINRIESGELLAVAEDLAEENGSVPAGDTVSGNNALSSDGTVSGNNALSSDSTVSGNGTLSSGSTISGNDRISADRVSSGEDTVSSNGTVSFNGMIIGEGTVSSDTSVSGNSILLQNGMVSANSTVSGNVDPFGNVIPDLKGGVSGNGVSDSIYGEERIPLEERRRLRSSLEETLEVNRADKEQIAGSQVDFSGVKIACLGDSITAASNLEGEEGYQQYAYPSRLKDLLGAREVYNLGIGGSSIGRYWADAFVDRYQEIPEDTDIIIVMGGTNDGFCASDKEFGNLEERAYRTFCGDLDELMKGLKDSYPGADIFFATPLPNVLHDYLRRERDHLLPQKDFVDVIITLAKEHGYGIIDLYNSNILDSHDVNVVADYIPDGVHGNQAGYQIMAEHFAAELIRYYGTDRAEEEVSGNHADSDGTAVSGNHADSDGTVVGEDSTDSGEEADFMEETSDEDGSDGEGLLKLQR